MILRPLFRTLAVLALLALPLRAGDYDHLLGVVKKAWPERAKGVAICSLDANQLALLDLVDTAKAQGLTLTIVNLKDAKESDRTIRAGLADRPAFVLIIDEDPEMGTKGPLLGKLVTRALGQGVPVVGLAVEALGAGAALAAGPDPAAKVYYNGQVLRKLKLAIPAGAEDKGPK